MILEPREKILRLRKEYRITQTELAMENISQSYIAAVENGTRNLTDDSINFFVENFNKIFITRNIDYRIDKSWLVESVESQSDKKYKKYLEDIDLADEVDTLYKIISEIGEEEEYYTIMEKTIMHHYMAVRFMVWDMYEDAHETYRKIYFFINEIEEKELFAKITYNILNILKVIGEYERVKEFEELVESEKENIDWYYKRYIYDTLIELFNEVEDYEAVLKYLRELEAISTKEEIQKIRFNKLQMLINLKDFAEAKRIYNRIDKEIGDYLYSYQFYFKLQGLEMYRALEKKSAVRKLYKELVAIQEKVELIIDTRSFFILGEAASYLNKKKEMMKYLTFACSMFDFSDYSSVELKYFRDILVRTLPECNKRDLIIVNSLWAKARDLLEVDGDNQFVFNFVDYYLKNKHYEQLKLINNEIMEFYSDKKAEKRRI